MSTETCILTTKDFTILEVMRDRCLGRDDPLAPILKRKIESALVVFREDVPANVATLSSRVTFRVDGREPDTRVLSHDRMSRSVGLFLPITTPRVWPFSASPKIRVYPDRQRRTSKRGSCWRRCSTSPKPRNAKRKLWQACTLLSSKAVAEIVRGAIYHQPRLVPTGSDNFDDPGPAAA